ncbi:G-type lectin S-receptor-like serine/threonine-protein kinase LECRK2 [Cornus florida]|uniref:G-type lectin S-receptor-like serine/threonine-protein kinase LECRK2 n=1 Tax=Cornus florida TaxID=4283 RepID=UPI00289E4EEC|nr:G-type lectin S-receptor-like serine/threonine-protein kinase LECRK2 [Cornus florida]
MFSFTLHFCLLIPILPLLAVAQTNLNISLGSSLQASDDSPPWHSPSGDFAFGFHRLDNQNLFLLAIWFDKIPDKTLVWYANGDNPAPEGSKVDLTLDGRFILNDPQGRNIWEAPIRERANYAAMLDNGNFVLVNNESGYVWESFQLPADTILPTQVLEVGGKLSSRQKESNFSKGRFQLRLRPDGNLVLNTIALPTQYENDPYYVSHTSDRANTMNSGYLVNFSESGYIYVLGRNGNIANLTSGNIVPARDFYYRATLDYDGVFVQYAHPKAPRNGSSVQSWSPVWSVPKDICAEIQDERSKGACGFNSYCIPDSNLRPACQCLPGFSFSDPNNKFNGCNQDSVQKCEPGAAKPEDLYDMRVLPNTFWPFSENYQMLKPFNEDDCSRSCFNDCNCVVAVFADDDICYKKKLPLSNGMENQNRNGKAFIKIPKSDISSGDQYFPESNREKKDQTTLILVLSLLLGGSVFLNFLLVPAISIVFYGSYQKKQKFNRVPSILETNLRSFTYKYSC